MFAVILMIGLIVHLIYAISMLTSDGDIHSYPIDAYRDLTDTKYTPAKGAVAIIGSKLHIQCWPDHSYVGKILMSRKVRGGYIHATKDSYVYIQNHHILWQPPGKERDLVDFRRKLPPPKKPHTPR